jgi:hypothetical protein
MYAEMQERQMRLLRRYLKRGEISQMTAPQPGGTRTPVIALRDM